MSAVASTRPDREKRVRTILVVDDERMQSKLVQRWLECAGYSVDTAGGAREALEKLAHHIPDVILSDVVMDEVDGFSLCRMLRRDPSLARVPIVLVSACFCEAEDRTLALEVGASALVERDEGMKTAIDAIEHAVAKRSSEPVPSQPSTLHVHRFAHQLARLQKDATRMEARYRAIFENAHDTIALLTPEGIVLDVNRRWEELLLRSREELIGLHIRDLSAPEDAEANVRTYAESTAVGNARGRTRPVPVRRADGHTVYLEFTQASLEIEGARAVLAIGRDVTEIVESERRCQVSDRKFRSLVENIPEVTWSATKDVHTTFMSANVARVTGFTAEEYYARSTDETLSRIHPDDRPIFQAQFEALFRDGTPLDVEYRYQHKDGRWLWMHCRAVRAFDDKGEPTVDGIFSDITSRKLLEEQVSQSQKIEAISQLSAGIAHDFNNVLAVIAANAEFLTAALADGENKDVAEETLAAANRGAALTARLLAFARRETAEAKEFDVNEVLVDTEKLLSRTLGRQVALTVKATPGIGRIRADVGQVENVIINMAVNARDAMPNGGGLFIETSNVDVDAATSEKDGLAPGRYVAISVRDTGVGMDEATRARMFEPFFTTKEKGRGTGLGLSTSYGIVRRYGGHIGLESTLGVGTTFTVYFPCIDGVASDPSRRSLTPSRPMKAALARIPTVDAAPQRRPVAVKDEMLGNLEALVQTKSLELEVANRELDALCHVVSRDLRAPIRAVEGFVEAALEDGGDALGDDVRKHLSRVREAAARMRDLTTTLLALSDVARAPIERASIDVRAVARDIARMLARREPSREVVLDVEEGLVVDADPRLFGVLLENLMSNAWKFTRGVCTPTVTIGRGEKGGLFVRDNGVGFESKHAQGLFEPFQRLCAAGQHGRTGVGLATALRIVRRHGGEIFAEAIPGSGATFRFTLRG